MPEWTNSSLSISLFLLIFLCQWKIKIFFELLVLSEKILNLFVKKGLHVTASSYFFMEALKSDKLKSSLKKIQNWLTKNLFVNLQSAENLIKFNKLKNIVRHACNSGVLPLCHQLNFPQPFLIVQFSMVKVHNVQNVAYASKKKCWKNFLPLHSFCIAERYYSLSFFCWIAFQ